MNYERLVSSLDDSVNLLSDVLNLTGDGVDGLEEDKFAELVEKLYLLPDSIERVKTCTLEASEKELKNVSIPIFDVINELGKNKTNEKSEEEGEDKDMMDVVKAGEGGEEKQQKKKGKKISHQDLTCAEFVMEDYSQKELEKWLAEYDRSVGWHRGFAVLLDRVKEKI